MHNKNKSSDYIDENNSSVRKLVQASEKFKSDKLKKISNGENIPVYSDEFSTSGIGIRKLVNRKRDYEKRKEDEAQKGRKLWNDLNYSILNKKKKRSDGTKTAVKALLIVGAVAAVLVGLFFLFRFLAFLPEEITYTGGAIAGMIVATIVWIIYRVTQGEGGCILWFILYVVFAVIFVLILMGTRLLFINDVDDLYTPEIKQTYYCSESQRDVITITSCTSDGIVYAEWMGVERYGSDFFSVELEGKITQKLNDGTIRISWTDQNVVLGSIYLNWENEVSAVITDDYSSLESDNKTFTTDIPAGMSINNYEDLEKIAGLCNIYVLTNDINLSPINWSPISSFDGILLGNGHSIKNLTIKSENCQDAGLFKTLDGYIQNINFENVNIAVSCADKSYSVGTVCGILYDNGSIKNVTVSGSVNAKVSENVGGFIGRCDSKHLEDLVCNANVTGGVNVGAIIGYYTPDESVSFSGFNNTGTIIPANSKFKEYIGYSDIEVTFIDRPA